MRNTLTATIMGDFGDKPSRRIKLNCEKQGNRYQWVEAETGNDTEVSGKSIAEAKQAAIDSWGRGGWKLEARWLDA